MIMINWAIFLFCAGWCALGFAAMFYAAYRAMTLIIGMEVGIVKEFKGQNNIVQQVAQRGPVTEGKLKEFIKSRFSPTEGDFAPYSDEEAFVQEQVDHLRRQGLSDDELDAFIRQAVGTDIGNPEDNG